MASGHVRNRPVRQDGVKTKGGHAVEKRQDGVELNEAAAIMETSAEAIRKRIQRGTLQGYKVDGRWFVILPNEYKCQEDDRTMKNGTYDDDPDGGKTHHDNSQDVVQAYETLVSSLKDEVSFLRQQLEARTEENRRKDHLLASKDQTISTLLERLPELPEVTQTSEDMRREILETMHQEIAATEVRIDEREAERERRLEERDQKLMETLRLFTERAQEQTQKKPWWRRK